MLPRIKEFCFNDSPWRIDYLGGLIYPSDSRTDTRITVYLSELSLESGDPLLNGSLMQPHRHEVITVNIGQISLLRIGSVWINGACVAPAEIPTQKEFVLTPGQLKLLSFGDQVVVDGESHPLFTQSRYRIGERAAKELQGSWLAIAMAPTKGTAFVAIPSTAIFQKCLATSPKAVQRLVFGELDKIVDPSCGFIHDEPGTYFVELFKDFRDTEAKAMANLTADPIGQEEYARFRSALIVASANQSTSQRGRPSNTHIKLRLPFSNEVKLTVLGKSLAFEVQRDGAPLTVWGFLATEIVSLSTRLVFDRLVIARKNDGTKGNNTDDLSLEQAWSKGQKPPDTTEHLYQPLMSGPPPDGDIAQLSLEAAGDFEAVGLETVNNPKEVQEYKNHVRVSADGSPFQGDATTGDPGPGGTGIPGADIEPNQAPVVPVTLDEFFAVLSTLQTNGFAFKTIAAAPTFRVRPQDANVVSFLPRSIKGLRSWHLIERGRKTDPRAYVVAELRLGGVWHYLIELERKGDEAFALQYFRAHAGTKINAVAIAQFMLNVASANGWRAKDRYSAWVFNAIPHARGGDVNRFAQDIEQALRK